jgi:hypothetical protein
MREPYLRRRSSDPRRPRVMRWRPVRAAAKRSQGHVQAGILSREMVEFGVPTLLVERKATSPAALYRELSADPARSQNPCMYGTSMRENREVSCSPVGLITERAAQARPRPQS